MIRTLTALALLATPAMAQPHLYDDVPADLAKAATAYDAAQVAGDGAALTRLLADDYRLFNGAGAVESKAQFIADSVDPNFRLSPFTVTEPVHTVWPDGAVLAGKVTLGFTDHGKTGAQAMRFTDVWARRDGRWQVVFTAVTRLPAKG